MDVIRDAIQLLNAGQTPVLEMDQALFAIGKAMVWKWPQRNGKLSYSLTLEGLHLEMALWKCMGESRE